MEKRKNLGIIGGGQLGSMLSISANKLGVKTVVLSDDIDAPAQNFCNEFITGNYNDIEFVCLPARHFSGRGPLNRNSTLWSSWAIKSNRGKIYFSGDSGYGAHFKKIGQEHGPFDFSLIDISILAYSLLFHLKIF